MKFGPILDQSSYFVPKKPAANNAASGFVVKLRTMRFAKDIPAFAHGFAIRCRPVSMP